MKKITEVSEEPNSVTLKKGAKGDYTWEIKIYGLDLGDIVLEIEKTDGRLRGMFGSNGK